MKKFDVLRNWFRNRNTFQVVLILSVLVVASLACKFGEKAEPKIEDKLKVSSPILKSEFAQTSGFFYRTKEDKGTAEYVFHLATYELDDSTTDTLAKDFAFGETEEKIEFHFADENASDMKTFDDMTGKEFPIHLRIYTEAGFYRFQKGDDGSKLKITEIKDGVIKGEIIHNEPFGDKNSIVGSFTAKATGEEMEKLLKRDEKD